MCEDAHGHILRVLCLTKQGSHVGIANGMENSLPGYLQNKIFLFPKDSLWGESHPQSMGQRPHELAEEGLGAASPPGTVQVPPSQHCRLNSRQPPRPLAPFPASQPGKKPGGRNLGCYTICHLNCLDLQWLLHQTTVSPSPQISTAVKEPGTVQKPSLSR